MIGHAVSRWLWLLLLLPVLAWGGQDCTAQRPTFDAFRRALALAAHTARELDVRGARVVVLARAGQDLAAYGLEYSHLGIAYCDDDALSGRGAWRVVHKLNPCGTTRGELYRQGLAEFFGDGLHRFVAGIDVLRPPLADTLPARLADDRWLAQLHEPRYSMLAYPWRTRYQRSNQCALETLARGLEPRVGDRRGAQRTLARLDYRPQVLRLPALTRLAARIGSRHIAFDDHPWHDRVAGRIATVTVESVFDWLQRSGHGDAPIRLRAPEPGRADGAHRVGAPDPAPRRRGDIVPMPVAAPGRSTTSRLQRPGRLQAKDQSRFAGISRTGSCTGPVAIRTVPAGSEWSIRATARSAFSATRPTAPKVGLIHTDALSRKRAWQR